MPSLKDSARKLCSLIDRTLDANLAPLLRNLRALAADGPARPAPKARIQAAEGEP